MEQTLFMYSTNCYLAYLISQKYYNQKHFVWCAPCFDCNSQGVLDRTNPPSSNPYDIYKLLKADVESSDLHSTKIKEIKIGLVKGASEKKNNHIITEEEYNTIMGIIKNADVRYFKPLIYIISYPKVKKLISDVSVDKKADIFSQEYNIEELPRNCFDIISYRGR